MSYVDLDRLYDTEVTSKFTPDRLVVECRDCHRFYGKCLSHIKTLMCHDTRIVYTDGACSNNGRSGAVAGIGIALGTDEAHQFSIPVNDSLDYGGKRTNQRAELLAALEGVRLAFDASQEWAVNACEVRARRHTHTSPTVVITTDSEYVVKGMTQWLPTWKANDMRKANGACPSNLDLFCELDEEVESQERDGSIVKFWHVDRSYNTVADQLAKAARVTAAEENDFWW